MEGLSGTCGGTGAKPSRRPVGQSAAAGAIAIGPPDAEDPDRPRDVLDRPFAQILQRDIELVADGIAHGTRDEDRPRLGDALQPRRDVDAIAIDVIALDDDIAQVDSDPELDLALARLAAIALGHARLDRHRAAHRLDRAGEIHQQPVARALDDAAAVLGDARLEELAEMALQPAKRALLVLAHETAEAGDVERQDRGQLAFGVLIFHRFNQDDNAAPDGTREHLRVGCDRGRNAVIILRLPHRWPGLTGESQDAASSPSPLPAGSDRLIGPDRNINLMQ